MATPTLTAYRQLNPHLAGKSDDELLEDLANQLHSEGTLAQYPDVVEAISARDREYRQAHKPGLAKEFVRNVVGGIDTGQGMLYSTLAQAGDASGIDAIKNFGLAGYQRNQQEAAENTPTIPSYRDVHSPLDAAYYAAGIVGQQAPQFAATLGATAAGGLLAGPPGALAAGIGAGYVQNNNYADLALSGGEDAASTAAAVGIVSGILESVVPLKVIRSTFGSAPTGIAKMGMEALLKRAEEKIPGIVGAMQHEILRNGSAEALTEMAQELTAMAGEMYSHRNDPSFTISDQEFLDRIIDNGLGGAILGGVSGVAEGPSARKNEIEIQRQIKARLAQISGPLDETYNLRPEENFTRPTQTPFSLDETYNQPVETPAAPTNSAQDERKRRVALVIEARNELATVKELDGNAEQVAAAEAKVRNAEDKLDEVGGNIGPLVEPPAPLLPQEATNQPAPTTPTPQQISPAEPPRQSIDEQYVQPNEAVSTLEPPQAFDERYQQQKEEIPPAGFTYAHQPPFEINGEKSPGYTQIDTFDYNGNNIESSNLEALRARGYDLPDVPKGLPRGNYTLDQIKNFKPKPTFTPKQDGPFLSDLPRKLYSLTVNPRGGIAPDKEGNIPARSFVNVLKRLGVSDAELDLYRSLGANFPSEDAKAGEKVNLHEMAQWMEDHTPKVEVKELSPGGSGVVPEFSRAQHELETKGYKVTQNIVFDKENKPLVDLERAVWLSDHMAFIPDRDRELVEKLISTFGAKSEDDAATGRYGVEPKKLEDMPGAVDLLVRLPYKAYDNEKHGAFGPPSEGILFSGPHFGKSDKNVLGSVRAYAEGDTLHVFEVQSDWAQQQHEQQASFDKNVVPTARLVEKMPDGNQHWQLKSGEHWQSFYAKDKKAAIQQAYDLWVGPIGAGKKHPLLKDYETLALKAAIKYAQDKGLKKIAISDAETAMMTEGHDTAYARPENTAVQAQRARRFLETDPSVPVSMRRILEEIAEERDFGSLSHEQMTWLRDHGFDLHTEISQEKGMRAAYDERLPNILRKLTGDRGEQVDYGTHKSGESPVFKTQHGPKSNISARVFRLEKIAPGQKLLFDGPKADPKLKFTPEELGGVYDSHDLEHMDWGDAKMSPLLVHRDVIPNIIPTLRREPTIVKANADAKTIEELASEGVRKDEQTKATTKRLVAVRDNESGTVSLYPVYESSGHRMRIDNGIEAKVDSKRALAEALGLDTRQARRQDDAIGDVLKEVTAGTKEDQFLGDLVNEKGKDGKPKSTVLAFLDGEQAAARRHFFFENEERFRDEAGYVAEQKITSKGSKGGSEGVPQLLAKLTELSPRDARAVQLLAGVLEAMPEAQRMHNTALPGKNAKADVSLIIKKLLRSPRKEVFAEALSKITDAEDLLTRDNNGRYFRLFTPQNWEIFKKLTEAKDVNAEDLKTIVDGAISEAGYEDRSEYLRKVIPFVGEKQQGLELPAEASESDGRVDTGAQDEEDHAAAATESGALKDLDEKLQDVGGAPSAPDTIITGSGVPDRARAVTGFSSIAAQEKLATTILNPPAKLATEVRNVLEARSESTISTPTDDLEFQAVKDDLLTILKGIFERGGVMLPSLTEDFLYGLYANLDKTQRESQSRPSTFRETNDSIQRIFHGVTSWLGDKGVDVRLVQRSLDSEVQFLQNQWGRSISYDDGRRIVVVGMQDVTTPSRDNLRVLMHEVAHQMFADEPVWVQRLLHDAVTRLTDLQLDVFSKTYDDRIKNRTLDHTVLMEEVLAEHLAFSGIDTQMARSWGQRLVDGIRKAYISAVLLYSNLRGISVSPESTVKYMELRFRDMLDKAIDTSVDFDTLTGNMRNVARYRATLHDPIGYVVEKYNAAEGQFIINDVTDQSRLASELNLENKLALTDVVIRDSRVEESNQHWDSFFGVKYDPVDTSTVLDRIATGMQFDSQLRYTARLISELSPLAANSSISLGLPKEDAFLRRHPAFYDLLDHGIKVNPQLTAGFSENDRAMLILHEAMHAATSGAVSAYTIFKTAKGTRSEKAETVVAAIAPRDASPKKLERLHDQVVQAMKPLEKLDVLFSHLKKTRFFPDEYGMTNLDEFVSESVSNRSFQRKLSTVEVPTHLRISGTKDSLFKTIVKLIGWLFDGAKSKSALESSLNGIEQIMMVAEPISHRQPGGIAFAPPITEQESDMRVQKDFEYEYAALNSQADLYHKLFDDAAKKVNMDFDTYLGKVLGIYNPEKSLADLQLKVSSRSRPIKVNENLRINDSAGVANQVASTIDRRNIVSRMLETASMARKKIADKSIELADKLPRYEKEFQRNQDRLVRFETMLHDITAIRDNALKILRKGLRGAERNAERLVRWATRHDGLAGVAAELFGVKEEEAIPEDYADLVVDAVDDHADDTFITDTLTAAQKANIDFDRLTPSDIETAIQAAARTTRDPHLIAVADGSPQAKADLSLLIYYAKTAPEDMVALSVRVEKDPDRKEQIISTIKKIIQGNYESATGLNDLFKDVRSGDIRVGKAKSSLTNAMRQLTQSKKQVELAKLRVKELEFAAKAVDEGIKKAQSEIGIRVARFEPHDGAQILLTPGNTVKEGTLKLGPTSNIETTKILMDNMAWLRANAASEGELLWQTIKDQAEGLKRVVGEHVERDFRESFWTRHMNSIPERLYSTGVPILKTAADRFSRYFGYRQAVEPIVTQGREVTLKYKEAQKATGFEKSWSGFKDTFWNPANHFIQHLTLLPSADKETNQTYVKDQTKLLFMRSAITRDAISKPGAFDAVWEALLANARVSKQVANQAAAWKVFVEDSDIYVKNPRTGRIEKAQRPALDVGLFTTQANIGKVFGVKETLDSVTAEGKKLWAEWMNTGKRPDLKALFNDDVLFHFVRPYIYDSSTLHFAAPALIDGKTRNKANPLNVQAAWESANNDVAAFAAKLFDLEDTVGTEPNAQTVDQRKAAFVDDTINFFLGQYKKIYGLSESQEKFNGKGMTADRFLASPMMDSITARDFPPEFIDYAVYDHTTLQNLLSQLAAHGAFGRDLGMFSSSKDPNGGIMWELQHAEADLRKEQAEYVRLSQEVKRDNPAASVKEIDKAIEEKVGSDKLNRYKNVGNARKEVRQIEQEVVAYFTSPNGSTRDMQLSQTIVGTLAGGMVNNLKSVLNSLYISFEPFMVYGIGKTGATQVGRMLESVARSGAGSFIQAFGGEAVLASKYARHLNENGVGRDAANETTTAQILADPGKNNVYEDAKLLGWLRKGRSIMFDTGFRGAEGERIAPKLRPLGLFSMMSIAENQGAMESQVRLVDDVLKAGISAMDAQPGALNDPSFFFNAKQINGADNMFDDLAFEELKDQFRRMGTTMEVEVRDLINMRNSGKTLGEIVVSPDLTRLAAAEGLRVISLPNDVSTSPVWMSNNPLGRIAMPLITWSLNKTNQVVGAFREPNGEMSRRVVIAAIASLALGMIPAAVLISLLTDQYDEKVLGKKSNLVGFNFDSPSQTGVALMERVGRIGTFGLAGDLVNGVRVYGTSGDLRGVSIDQRVVFVNTLMSMIGLASTAYNQEGTLTYDTFYRPLINTLGGGGILQNQQILNNITNTLMGAPIFTAEAETTARINALNYLRGAGRVTGLDVRSGGGMRSIPTPIKPWVNEMVVASYGNNASEFVSAYRKAVDAARDEGKADPEDYVKRSFETYHPLRYTFRTAPSKSEVGQLMGAMSDKGREDVSQALQYFNAYAASIGLAPYDGRASTVKSSAKTEPSPWGTPSKASPWK